MPRQLTSATTLDNLKKEARRWLKALRENDPEACERMQRAYPSAPHPPVLRDVQHALACEYGMANWKDLKQALQTRPAAAPALDTRAHLVRRFSNAPALTIMSAVSGPSHGPPCCHARSNRILIPLTALHRGRMRRD
jgi:hypothetical protein